MDPRITGVGATGESEAVIAGDGCGCMRRLSGVTFGVTPTKKKEAKKHASARLQEV
jgi:hypothetical protein